METLKRPSEIALDAQSFEQVSCKRRRRYYEQLEHVEVCRHIIELKQLRHKRHEHRERVKFALFLKYLIHHLCLTDEDKYKKAKQVRFQYIICHWYEIHYGVTNFLLRLLRLS